MQNLLQWLAPKSETPPGKFSWQDARRTLTMAITMAFAYVALAGAEAVMRDLSSGVIDLSGYPSFVTETVKIALAFMIDALRRFGTNYAR